MRYSRRRVGRIDMHYIVWDSVLEHVQDIVELGDRIQVVTMPLDGDWVDRQGIDSWETLAKMAVGYWDKGMDKTIAMIDRLSHLALPEPVRISRRSGWSEDDGELDLDRYMVSQPAFRTTFRRPMLGQQFVTILVDISGNGGASGDSLFWRGVAAVCLTNMLENAGYSVEVISYDGGIRSFLGGDGSFFAVRLKEQGQPIDLAMLVNGTSPWYFRGAFFASYSFVEGHTVSGGFGNHILASPEDIAEMTPDQSSIVVDRVYCMEDAANLISHFIGVLRDASALTLA